MLLRNSRMNKLISVGIRSDGRLITRYKIINILGYTGLAAIPSFSWSSPFNHLN
jgi:hypothetical protein